MKSENTKETVLYNIKVGIYKKINTFPLNSIIIKGLIDIETKLFFVNMLFATFTGFSLLWIIDGLVAKRNVSISIILMLMLLCITLFVNKIIKYLAARTPNDVFNYSQFNPTIPINFNNADDFEELYYYIFEKKSKYKYSELISDEQRKNIKKEIIEFKDLIFKDVHLDFADSEMEKLSNRISFYNLRKSIKKENEKYVTSKIYEDDSEGINYAKLEKENILFDNLFEQETNKKEINKIQLLIKNLKELYESGVLTNLNSNDSLFIKSLIEESDTGVKVNLFDLNIVKNNNFEFQYFDLAMALKDAEEQQKNALNNQEKNQKIIEKAEEIIQRFKK